MLMKKIESWKVYTFVGALVLIALFVSRGYDLVSGGFDNRVIYSSRPVEPPQPTSTPVEPAVEPIIREPVVREKTPAELAADHARYLARYLNADYVRKPGSETVAVAVATQDGKPNGTIANALVRRFTSPTFNPSALVFTPAFVSDGLFREVFGDSSTVISDLELKTFLSALLLAQQTVEFSTNASLENVITATMGLEVVALSVSSVGENQMWTFTASGAGFSPREARAMAEERLLKQIANDTKMSIDQFLPSQRNQ